MRLKYRSRLLTISAYYYDLLTNGGCYSVATMSNNLASPWFNDRRIIFNGPRRLRDNLSQILNNLNQQIMHENPVLITQLSEQLQRLNDVLHGRADNARRLVAERDNRRTAAPLADAPLSSPSTLSAINRTLSDDLVHAMDRSPSTSVANNQGSSTRTHRRYTDGSIDRFPSSVNNRFDFNGPPNDSTVVSIEVDGQQTAAGVENSSRNDVTDPPTIVSNSTNESATTPTENSATPDQNASGAAAGRRGNESNPEWRNLTELSRTVNSQRIIKYACFFVPFLLILLFRAVFVYTKDIFTITTLFTVFVYADGFITSQATTKSNASRAKVFGLSLGLLLLLAITYVILYGNDETARLLIFSLPQTFVIEEGKNLRLSTILWYVLVTDLAAKFITIINKCQIILLPANVVSYKRRPLLYQWVEYSMHVYRWCLPILPWRQYLLAPSYPSVFRYFLTTLYLGLKVLFALNKLQSWWSCLRVCLRPRSIGQKPDSMDLQNCGPQCSICYCPFENPVQLECKHIYCEDCISTWLDKEKTCPICRAKVSVENRSWRDGSTSMTLQIC